MQMRIIWLNRSQTILVFHTISNDSQTLITADHVPQFHLNIAKKLIFRKPAVAMQNFHMTT